MSLEQALDELVSRGPFLLGVDFDGTLAPIVERPDMAVPDPRAVQALKQLANQDSVDVAVVSGRSLTDLKERLGDVPGAIYVGEHGNDMGGQVEESEDLREARELVEGLKARFPAATVEIKGQSVTFHTRSVSRDEARSAGEEIRQWADGRVGINLLEGKEVFELTTATGTKGDAIKGLARGRPVVYIGDDVTDENVFSMLGPDDVGIKVGDGQTAASHRVEDVAGVVRVLERIALGS